jgi:hypothetical protein
MHRHAGVKDIIKDTLESAQKTTALFANKGRQCQTISCSRGMAPGAGLGKARLLSLFLGGGVGILRLAHAETDALAL